jgi:hypothetical protein
VMASFRRGRGEVFNGGTTEWAHALKAGDPFITQITRNVLKRSGLEVPIMVKGGEKKSETAVPSRRNSG